MSSRRLLPASAGQARAGPGIQARQRRVIEDMGRGVAHFLHRQTDPAGFLVKAFLAAAIRGLADARDEGERPFQDSNHLANRDIARLPRQYVAATATELAPEKTVPRQLEQDRFEEFPGQALTFRELRCLNRPLPGIFGGEFQHRLETVFRFLRQHGLSL